MSNIASQGLSIITGQQKGFSWSSIAASAVGGAVGNYVGGKFDIKGANGLPDLTKSIVKNVVSGIASNVANQLTQIALDGKGKLSWTSVAVSGIYGVGSGYSEYQSKTAEVIAQQRAAQGVENRQLYSTAPTQKGDFTRELLNSQQVEAAEDKKYGFNGLRNTYFDNGLTSLDDQAAVSAGGLRVHTFGEPKDQSPAQGIKVKENAEAVNRGNIANKANSQTPLMNGVASLYYKRDSITGYYIDPATNQPSFKITSELQRGINDSVLRNQSQPSSGLRPYSINNKYQLSDGTKNPSVTPEQYSKNFTDSFDRVIVGTTISAVPGIYGMATGLTVGQFVTGAAVSTSVNAAAQYKFNGTIEMSDLIGAGLTGGFTYGRGLGYSMLVNTDGAINTALYNGEDLRPKVIGALIGTPLGAGIGYLAQQQLVKLAIPSTVAALINGNYSFANLISVTPNISSSVLSSGAQEGAQKVVDDAYENRSYRKYNK